DSGNRLYWRMDRKRVDAEQLRDAVLSVAGNLDPALGGPSTELTPFNTRRTVYGRISRYKLDEYLQLFDFPSPNISAEKRFTTTVPLQRLFFMNSDFMQQQGELLAKRVASEPTNTARIQKAYRLAFGRAPSDGEVRAALEYLAAEPMRTHEERKKEKDAKSAKDMKGTKDAKAWKNTKDTKETKEGQGKDEDSKTEMTADGMMAGVVAGAGKKDDAKKLLPVTTWGL